MKKHYIFILALFAFNYTYSTTLSISDLKHNTNTEKITSYQKKLTHTIKKYFNTARMTLQSSTGKKRCILYQLIKGFENALPFNIKNYTLSKICLKELQETLQALEDIIPFLLTDNYKKQFKGISSITENFIEREQASLF